MLPSTAVPGMLDHSMDVIERSCDVIHGTSRWWRFSVAGCISVPRSAGCRRPCCAGFSGGRLAPDWCVPGVQVAGR